MNAVGMATERPASGAVTEVELVAGPFPRISAIAAFRDRIAALPGVLGVGLERYGGGSISLRVRHRGTAPFAVQVRGLRDLGVEVTSASESRIEVRIRSAA